MLKLWRHSVTVLVWLAAVFSLLAHFCIFVCQGSFCFLVFVLVCGLYLYVCELALVHSCNCGPSLVSKKDIIFLFCSAPSPCQGIPKIHPHPYTCNVFVHSVPWHSRLSSVSNRCRAPCVWSHSAEMSQSRDSMYTGTKRRFHVMSCWFLTQQKKK